MGKALAPGEPPGLHRGSPPHSWGKRDTRCGGVRGNRFTPTLVGKARLLRPERCRRAVHPHTRGESPIVLARIPDRFRFTPTLVGKANRSASPGPCDAVHPHTRGESVREYSDTLLLTGSPPHSWGKLPPPFLAAISGDHVVFGSPPHSWGKLHEAAGTLRVHRFTPTLVGKAPMSGNLTFRSTVHPHTRGESASPLSPRQLFSVHPHTRGESTCRCLDNGDGHGSPPHSWGKRDLVHFRLGGPRFTPHSWGKRHAKGLRHSCRRFTPTLVGKAADRSRVPGPASVHPHTRGESAHTSTGRECACGSPPHSWGKPPRSLWPRGSGRFTPTLVGKAWPRRLCRRRFSGSPPHSWGKRHSFRDNAVLARFTPTLVGKAAVWRRIRTRLAVHPHTRGESDAVIEFDVWPARFTPTLVGKASACPAIAKQSAVHPHTRGES